MLGEMCRLLVGREPGSKGRNAVSPLQAFMVSIASRVGTGNLAGVATAIVLGGPGAVFLVVQWKMGFKMVLILAT